MHAPTQSGQRREVPPHVHPRPAPRSAPIARRRTRRATGMSADPIPAAPYRAAPTRTGPFRTRAVGGVIMAPLHGFSRATAHDG